MHREIAVVGISTELPSGSWSDSNLDHESFFEFLLQHGQAYERIPADRFNIQGWNGRDLGQICTEQGSFLKGAQLFDNVEFGVSAKDARNMAPGTRRLIENAFLALLDSGIEYRSRNIGCFASSTNHNVIQISETDEYEIEGSFAGTPSMIANKVSYHLDLLGPSIPTDTACSSSATALHLAVNSLLQGDCEAAVVAGAQINHLFLDWMMYSQGSVLAPDGKCKPFDASANGFSRSEGVVAIVIKPLENAVNDGDYIYGTILGTAINGGGNAASPGAPIPEAQTLAMKKAFERSGRSPQDVDYVECHATGTHVGDPAEANWVGQQFRREETLVIGSVKGNLGHSEITAFLASLSKVLSILRHKVIPPNVNLTRPNPAIKWDEHNMIAPTVATGLSCRSGVRSLIAIASSGIGGTNAHIVVQEPPPRNVASCQLGAKWPVLLLAGGLSPRSAMTMASNAVDTALAHPEHQRLLAIKFCRGARQMSWRTFTILDDATSPTKPPQLPPPVQSPRTKPPIVFVFSGQGPQHINMGRQLFAAFSTFRTSVLESDKVFKARKGYSLVDDIGLFGDKPPNGNLEEWPIHITLPALLIFQIALYDLLLDLGVRPDVLIGHSAGETALVYASQAGSRALAVELAIARGQAFSAVESFGGTMAALSCSVAKAKDLISKVASKNSSSYPVDIACYNAPEAVAIAGPSDQIDQIIALAQLENITGRKIRTRTPVHSTMIELCKEQYIRSVEEAFARHGGSSKPQIRTYSTCHGDLFDRPYDTDYFWNNARHPVLFTETLAKLLSHHPNAVFMEISAHPVLSAYVNEAGVPISHTLAGARRSKTPVEYRTLLQSLGQLTLAGYNSVSFHRLNFNDDANFDLPIKLPEYPFMRKSFPFYLDGPASLKKDEPHNGPLNHKYLRINQNTHPWLVDHKALGEAIMPACGFVEMAFEFGAAVLMEVNFRKILPTARDKPLPVRVDLDGPYWSVTASTSGKGPDLHADGYLSFEEPPCLTSMPDMDALRSRSDYVTHDAFYAAIGGLEYGPTFRRVLEMHINSKEAIAKIQGYTPDLINHGSYYIHPAILDCCIQPVEHFPGDIDPDSYYLPSRIKNVILHRNARSSNLPEILYAHHVLHSWQPDLVVVDVTIFDERGSPMCSMQELELQRHSVIQESKIKRHFEMVYQPGALPTRPLLTSKMSEREIKGLCPELQEKAIDVCDSSVRNAQPNSSVAEVVSLVLDKSLSSISSDSTRVLNIMFIAADGNGLHERVSKIFDRHHSLYIDYTICNDTKGVLKTWNTTGRFDTLAFDQPTSTQGYEQNSFDLVYVVEPDTLGNTPSTIAQVTRTLVADGGHVFFIGSGSSDSERVFGMQDNGFERLTSYSHHQHILRVVEFVFHLPEVPGDFQKDIHFIQYVYGRQVDLISILGGFDTTEACDIWIMADEGRSGDEATGFVRTLRKEFLNWSMKLAIFPSLFTEDDRTGFLKRLPHRLQCETEIIVSSKGEISVPRIFPFLSCKNHQTPSIDALTQLPSGHVVVQTSARSSDTGYTGFIGSILASSSPDLAIGSTVIGMTTSMQSEFIVASSSLRALDSVSDNAANIISLVPGFVVAALAPTLSAFIHPKRLPAWRVLLTHSKSSIGRVVRDLYRLRNVEVVELEEDATLYQLGQLGRRCFDLVITGHHDPKYLQVIDLLLRQDTGRLFSWNAGQTSLASICAKEPWHIGDAIEIALSRYGDYLQNSGRVGIPVKPVQPAMNPRSRSLIFRPDRSYLLLGGLGSLGPYVALWMYERGARHIALSSRRANGLYPGNSTSRQSRIIRYLQLRRDLNLQVVVFDPLDVEKTKKHISAISPQICGSIILTASPSDGFSLNLTTDDFKKSQNASLLVLHALQSILNIENLDFLVNFGSVTSLCGNAGQSSYTSAKTALEGELRQFKNAFSFICPPISGTTLINELYAVKAASTLLAWQISPSKMFQWLEDAMLLLKSGQRIWTYIPDWDWEDVAKALGLPAFATYLCPQQNTDHGPSTVDDNNEHVTELITRHLDLRPEDLSDDVSLASYGLDSLSASRLSLALKKAFGLKISQIQLLADVSTGDIRKRISAREKENQATSSLDRIREEMMGYIRKYTSIRNSSSPWRSNTSRSTLSTKKVVLVTGSTGALGANILHQLILDPEIEAIYTLNRPSKTMNLPEKQKIVWCNQGLPEGLEEEAKVHCLAYDITAVRLGLPINVYEEVASSVTHIIHNAWISDFSQPLSAYDDLLKGTRNLIDLALSSRLPTPPSFAFISTTGVCQFNASSVPCPELPITLEQVMALDKEQSSDHAGYIQSKWIAEQIIGHFRSLAPLKASIIRVGQLTGAPNGSWDPRQWLPAVVKSGLSVGCLPDGDDAISWLPVSVAAAVVIDLMDTDGVTHVVHPRPMSWDTIMKSAGTLLDIPLLPYADWFRRLEASAEGDKGQDLGNNPAIKLLDFFRLGVQKTSRCATESMGLLASVSTERARSLSSTLSNPSISQLGQRDVESWIAYWRRTGYLPSGPP